MPETEQGATVAEIDVREVRRKSLAERVREGRGALNDVRQLVALRKELDEAPKRFQEELLIRQREVGAELSKARGRADAATAAQEELVREFVPEELRRRRGRLDGARNDAIAACRGTEEDVRSLGHQLHQLKEAKADALAVKRAEGKLAEREVALSELRAKADEAQAELDRSDAEFQAALAAAMA